MNDMYKLIDKLEKEHSLTLNEYRQLLENRNDDIAEYLREKADRARKSVYGHKIYLRGLIEISNICKNNCLYCGIRKENKNCDRYRLSEEEILNCCHAGYKLGFRTFVMQGGEDSFYTDEVLAGIIKKIKAAYPDCAITLSLGERSFESYKTLYDAGADRYLLRHEAKNAELYKKLHPDMKLENRLTALANLKKIGYQTGCGFMVGAPYQTLLDIAEDLKFIEEFSPEMCGIGPFIPHKDTVFKDEAAGTKELCCYLLSIIRLIKPNILLPATTALGTISKDGREAGILSGANVVMPNLSPLNVRKKYELYDNKLSTGAESAACILELQKRMEKIGFLVVFDRGDIKEI